LCYTAGIIAGNLPGVHVPEETVAYPMYALVLLSIPLLLFSSDFSVWRKMGVRLALSFFFCVIAVTIAVIAGTVLFKSSIEEAWIINSMLMGIYTGGAPNLIGLSLGVSKESFLVVSGAEILFGGTWLLILLTLARPLFGKILRPSPLKTSEVKYSLDERMYWKTSPLAGLYATLIAGIAAGLSFLLFDMSSTAFTTSVFLLVTTLGLAGAAIPHVRQLKGSFGLGNYFLLIFCVLVGSLANAEMVLGAAPMVLGLVGFVMLIAVSLHLLLCVIFKIDLDTFVISSAAAIFGPPFIAPVAKAIRNPLLIPIGLALGVLGLAVGNYLGISVSHLLRTL
jgi:uncharacterized membrane protein